jgi:hypothetical protein
MRGIIPPAVGQLQDSGGNFTLANAVGYRIAGAPAFPETGVICFYGRDCTGLLIAEVYANRGAKPQCLHVLAPLCEPAVGLPPITLL